MMKQLFFAAGTTVSINYTSNVQKKSFPESEMIKNNRQDLWIFSAEILIYKLY